MNKKKKRRILKLSAFLGSILILLTILYLFGINKGSQKPEIDFLNIGQGDATLLKLPNKKLVLVDGGPDNLVLKRLGENLPFYRRKIDLIIISHFHDDHLTGLVEVVRRYQVGAIIYMKGAESSELWQIFLRQAKIRKIQLIALENEAQINYSPGCSLKIFNPLILGIKKDSNNSLITKLNCQALSALLSGDNSLKVEEALLKTRQDLTAKILKASHHGSKSANSEAFLKSVNPVFFIISVGLENRFGHPSLEIIERVTKLGLKIKRADQEGTIRIYGAQ